MIGRITLPRMRESLAGTALLPCLLTLAACGSGAEAEPPTVTLRDSAGVEIVQNRGDGWAAGNGWRLASEPQLQIGMAEGADEYLLSRVATVRRLDDGSILLANSGSASLRHYDAGGRFIRSIGGQGEGPGEFRGLSWFAVLPGDSLVAFDRMLRRVSLFDLDGAFLGSTAVTPNVPDGVPTPLASWTDGSLLLEISHSSSRSQRALDVVDRGPSVYVRTSRAGQVLDTIAVLPGPQWLSSEMNGMVLTMPALFGRFPVAAVLGERAFLASNDRYEIGVYGPDGRLQRLIRREQEPAPVTTVEFERIRGEILAGQDEPALRAQLERMLDNMPVPETYPAFTTFLPDDAGNVWVRETPSTEEGPSTWAVFDPDGRLLGSLQLPAAFLPRHIGEDSVVGVLTDELGVQRVVVYQLIKGEAGA